MNEAIKHFYIPDGISFQEPIVFNGSSSPVVEAQINEPLLLTDVRILKDQFATNLEEVAPDLKSYGLARQYSESLFNKLVSQGAKTLEELVKAGAKEFHFVGKYILGPLAVSFVDTALKGTHGKAIFPARDATPFFYIAKTLKALAPELYPVELDNIQNPVFNRKLWGVEDEQDPENQILEVTHPLVQKLLSQMGFWSDQEKSFIEVGCWGSMIDQLKDAMVKGQIPHEEFSVYFLYTHLPNNIFGFTNIHAVGIPESVLETVADTWEAFPKFFKRPTNLIEVDSVVKASLEGKLVNSPFLPAWSLAALQGVVDAASDFVATSQVINPRDEILKLWQLSVKAQSGEFTGVLPNHTETWSEGESWKASWKWGKIPPLK